MKLIDNRIGDVIENEDQRELVLFHLNDPPKMVYRSTNRLSVSSSNDKGTKTTREVFGKIDKTLFEKATQQYLNEARSLPTEHAIVIQKNGDLLHFESNKETNVDMFGVDYKDAMIIHNDAVS